MTADRDTWPTAASAGAKCQRHRRRRTFGELGLRLGLFFRLLRGGRGFLGGSLGDALVLVLFRLCGEKGGSACGLSWDRCIRRACDED